MREFATNDQANYYSTITSITINGKNALEMKGKFIDDLHKNAFDGTNGKDAVKHIEYFLRIVDPIDLPNVNQDKLRVVVFPISLVGSAHRWFDEIKGSIDSWVDLTAKFFRKYYPPSRTRKINTPMIKWDPTNPKFESSLASNFVNYKTMDIFTKGAFWINDGYCNGGNLPGAYIIGNSLHYQDYEWYKALEGGKLKDEALRNKAIIEGTIDDDIESCYKGYRSRYKCEDSNHDHEEREYMDEHDVNNEELFDNATQERASRSRYDISSELDTSYRGFLEVGTTLDIFQNIHILYLQYGVLVFPGYDVLILFPSWSLVSTGTDMPYLLDGYDVLVFRIINLQNNHSFSTRSAF
ncbi:hypothetical protein Tco_0857957 [Tanacetum coccineum]|uniref:Retrotransposon gag domain-containing protein n=1 Tax=Tanacetum coccineum TaxID=301880 RepID=A0ABQ5B813_9ASTR